MQNGKKPAPTRSDLIEFQPGDKGEILFSLICDYHSGILWKHLNIPTKEDIEKTLLKHAPIKTHNTWASYQVARSFIIEIMGPPSPEEPHTLKKFNHVVCTLLLKSLDPSLPRSSSPLEKASETAAWMIYLYHEFTTSSVTEEEESYRYYLSCLHERFKPQRKQIKGNFGGVRPNEKKMKFREFFFKHHDRFESKPKKYLKWAVEPEGIQELGFKVPVDANGEPEETVRTNWLRGLHKFVRK